MDAPSMASVWLPTNLVEEAECQNRAHVFRHDDWYLEEDEQE